jgi:hypothetical protein
LLIAARTDDGLVDSTKPTLSVDLTDKLFVRRGLITNGYPVDANSVSERNVADPDKGRDKEWEVGITTTTAAVAGESQKASIWTESTRTKNLVE